MNLVLLVNTLNLSQIREFIKAAAASQQDKAQGALAVVYQKRVGKDFIEAMVTPLLAKFSAGAQIAVDVNSELSNDSRNATLFAIFVAQAYSRFPGPWLVVDGPGLPKGTNFIQALSKQHKGLGGDASGRATKDGSSLIPVGPVVIGLPVQKLSWFSPGATESWRAKARFLLGRCGFRQVPLDEYLFQIPKALTEAPAAIQAPVGIPSPVVPPVFNPAVFDQEPQSIGPFTTTKIPLPGDTITIGEKTITFVTEPTNPSEIMIGASVEECAKNAAPLIEEMLRQQGAHMDPEVASTQDSPSVETVLTYHEMDKEMLFALIEERGFDKPHHSTGKPKLVAILEEDGMAKHGAATNTPA